jgi:3-deoxy-D-manno-octulosonic-acid transferase
LIVPRHPQRFDEVAALIARHGFPVSRRSTWGAMPPAGPGPAPGAAGDADSPETAPDRPAIWLGDSLGEMALYYGMSDVALLGGSFERLGGQNLIEAAACGCPVVMGPHTFNFAEAAELALAAGAAQAVTDMATGCRSALALAVDPALQTEPGCGRAHGDGDPGPAGQAGLNPVRRTQRRENAGTRPALWLPEGAGYLTIKALIWSRSSGLSVPAVWRSFRLFSSTL